MQRQRRLYAVVPAAMMALGLGLSGCSPSTPADDPSSAAPPSPEAPATEAPRESVTPPSRGSTPSTVPAEPSVDVSEDPSIRPTRAVVIKGAVAYSKSVLGYPGPIAKRVGTCVVDKGFEKWSDKTLVAIADANIDGIDPSETVDVTKATQECVTQFS